MYVLVTTEFRGVFFGELVDGSCLPEEIVLRNARNCVSWSQAVKGVFGLAAIGPNSKCRIGPSVADLTLYRITAVATVDEKAVKAWEKAPWS